MRKGIFSIKELNKGQIHKFSQGGLNLVYDVGSGSLHAVDETVWELLDTYPIPTLDPKAQEAYAEIALLEAQGCLFAPDPALGPDEEGIYPVKALCLNVAHTCNLRCGYCFAEGGSFGGERELMTSETAKEAVDFLLDSPGGPLNLEIDFFGGEPLLNFPVVRETIEYGEARARRSGRTIHFTLTTNATLVTPEVVAFLREKKVSLILSLDGREMVHDRMRGEGSYTQALAGIRQILAGYPEADYYLRGTYTRHNLDFAADVRHFLKGGFRRFSLEPVVGTEEAYALQEEDLAAIADQYEELAEMFLDHRRTGDAFSFFHFQLDLTGGPCMNRRLRGCGAGCEYLAVTPGGDLYPCHQFVGREEFILGNLSRGGLSRPDLGGAFRETHALSKDECRVCWARYLCGGGCHANAHLKTGTIRVPDDFGCALGKMRLEVALGIQGQLAAED